MIEATPCPRESSLRFVFPLVVGGMLYVARPGSIEMSVDVRCTDCHARSSQLQADARARARARCAMHWRNLIMLALEEVA